MNVLITGGAGYVGSALVPELIKKKYKVTVLDLFIYGNTIDQHPNLKLVKGDIRDQELLKKTIPGNDVVIHLACISNDPSFELNPDLGKSINLDSFEPLVKLSRLYKVKRFLYASSSSVYGIKKEKNVTEDMPLEPLTDYSLFKAECEKILNNYGSSDEFVVTTLRPATVCGYAKRQRLDVVVNILSNLGYHKRKIIVLGGNQLRPNIHIKDMVRAYIEIIEAKSGKINKEIFNVGTENIKVTDIANLVRNVMGEDIEIEFKETDDKRSYHISSEKIKEVISFQNNFTIKNAIEDLKTAFDNKLLFNPLINDNYFNIEKMKKTHLK